MIKKILAIMALALGLLVPVTVATAPAANAATCVSKQKSTVLDVTSGTFPVGVWHDTFRMYYRTCDEPHTRVCDETHCYNLYQTTTYVDKLTLVHDYDSGSFGTCGSIDYWGFNPNALGGTWDPVTRTGNCGTTTLNFTWDPAPVKITQQMSSAEECVALTVIKYPSGTTKSSDTLCVTFTM